MDFFHIADRFVIHFFSAIGLVHGMYYLIAWIVRKRQQSRKWLPVTKPAQLVLAGLLVVFFAFLREPFDVSSGQWVGKAYIDVASWIFGSVIGVMDARRLILLEWLDK